MMHKILIVSEFLRILSTIIILYNFDIPIFIKILLIILFDKIDCSHMTYPFTGPLFLKNTNICKSLYYQKSDKITDSICYTLLLFYIINYGDLSYQWNNLLIFLFIYRIIGTIIFLLSSNRIYLVYFPNFFLSVCFVLMTIGNFPILKKITIPALFLTFIIQFLIEINLHKRPLKKIVKKYKFF